MTHLSTATISDSPRQALLDLALRLALIPFLIITFLRTVQSGLYWLETYDKTNLADWLINYQGGFVRRGLIGEVAFQIHTISGWEVGAVATAFQLTAYLIFFACSGWVLLKTRAIAPYFLLIFSPFLFRFQLQGHGGGFRKEIISFALLALLVWVAAQFSEHTFKKCFIALLLIYPLVLFSHEMLLLMLTHFIIIYDLKIGLNRRNLPWITLAILPSFIVFGLAILFSGEPGQAIAICNSIGNKVENCASPAATAIGYIGVPAGYSAQGVARTIQNRGYIGGFITSIFLVAIAYWPLRENLKRLVKHPLSLMLFGLSLLGMGLVSIVAQDWDRHLYMELVALFLVLLAVGQRYESTDAKVSALFRQRFKAAMQQQNLRRWGGVLLMAVATFLYAKTWYIASCCTGQPPYLPLSPFGVDVANFLRGLVGV